MALTLEVGKMFMVVKDFKWGKLTFKKSMVGEIIKFFKTWEKPKDEADVLFKKATVGHRGWYEDKKYKTGHFYIPVKLLLGNCTDYKEEAVKKSKAEAGKKTR